MFKVSRTLSFLVMLLGSVHVLLAFPPGKNTDTLWFVGSGLAITLAGLLNLVALDRAGTAFSFGGVAVANVVMGGLFCFGLQIIGEPQVYVGTVIFMMATAGFTALFF